MKIDEDTYIVGGYYLDFDNLGQFRVFGPNNHLYLGLVDIPRHKIRIDSVEAEDGASLKVEGKFTAEKINLYLPVMGDVRTLREITADFSNELRQFLKMRESQHTLHGEAQPLRVEFFSAAKNSGANSKFEIRNSKLIFRRDYGESYYQSSFEFPAWVEVEEIEKPYKGFALKLKTRSEKWEVRNENPEMGSGIDDIKKSKPSQTWSKSQKISLQSAEGANPTSHIAHPTSQEEIPFILCCETNDTGAYDQSCVLLGTEAIDFSVFGKDEEKIRRFWERTKAEVEHLLCWGKTSGDRFGTVFPRDWMESAALGVGDIPAAGIDYMLKKSLAHVNEKGEGWHEDVVGEYKYKYEAAGKDLFDRKMIDIEPWYFICLRWVTDSFWQDKEAVSALRRSAKYILRRAKEQEYITFEPLPEDKEIPAWQKSFGMARGYWTVGDWRDSQWAYKHIHPIVAPFSVSAVFYPEALKMIAKIGEKIGVDRGEVERLIEVWRHKKEAYRFEDYNGTSGFALALYDTWKQLRVHHLDEAYLYFLSDDYAKEDILGFARRMLDMEYFYTEAGPLIIARNNEMGYTDEEYHGLVIWTKQAAFAIAGLARALSGETAPVTFFSATNSASRHTSGPPASIPRQTVVHGSTATSQPNDRRRAFGSEAQARRAGLKQPPPQKMHMPQSLLRLTSQEKDLIRRAAIKTAQNLICAYCCLDSIPELHKDGNGKAAEWMKGVGSSVQLWSAVGARRIFRECEKLVKGDFSKGR